MFTEILIGREKFLEMRGFLKKEIRKMKTGLIGRE